MKYKIAAAYIALFWVAVLVLGFWVFKILLQASPVPEFGTGLVSGVVYGLVMRGVAGAAADSVKDFINEMRSTD